MSNYLVFCKRVQSMSRRGYLSNMPINNKCIVSTSNIYIKIYGVIVSS